MSNSEDNIDDTIPWPGFVDILSAVIMVFIFFVMLTVIIISQLSKKTKVTSRQSQAHLEESNYIENRTKHSKEQILTFDDSNNKLYISYNDLGINLTETLQKTVNNHFDVTMKTKDEAKTKDTPQIVMPFFEGKEVLIYTYPPYNISYTAEQEISLNRAFNVRNQFLNYGVPKNKIKIKIIPKDSDLYLQKECSKETSYGCVTVSYSDEVK